MRKSSTKEFIQKANLIHKGRFNYTESVYVNSKMKLKIGCTVCNHSFLQTPNDHLNGKGCPSCKLTSMKIKIKTLRKKLTLDQFIQKANSVHGSFYIYSETEYRGSNFKLKIICPKHGSFWQQSQAHLQGQGCPSCNRQSKGEREIERVLNKFSIHFEKEYRFKECVNDKTGRKLPFDF